MKSDQKKIPSNLFSPWGKSVQLTDKARQAKEENIRQAKLRAQGFTQARERGQR